MTLADPGDFPRAFSNAFSSRDLGAIAAFHAIPGGRLMHLHHNKHELTFVWRGA